MVAAAGQIDTLGVPLQEHGTNILPDLCAMCQNVFLVLCINANLPRHAKNVSKGGAPQTYAYINLLN